LKIFYKRTKPFLKQEWLFGCLKVLIFTRHKRFAEFKNNYYFWPRKVPLAAKSALFLTPFNKNVAW